MILLDTGIRKMPDKCSLCNFFRVESQMYCTAVVGYTTVSKPYERRPAWCPLHEVTDTDTISRQDAINLIERYCDNGCEIAEDKWCPDCQQSKFAEMIKALPPSPSNLTDKEKDFLLDCLYKTDWTYRAVADTIIKKLHLIP